ncbi:MAG TPA: hypothetical protein ENN40_07645 [Candidatus Aminicenantes bacterium]|nr:hypothetical protein [Candidatus Aminicenantes bacterium]
MHKRFSKCVAVIAVPRGSGLLPEDGFWFMISAAFARRFRISNVAKRGGRNMVMVEPESK